MKVSFLLIVLMLSSEISTARRYGETEEGFDFVVVGAGAAGCVIANRLSEEYKVILIEAGGDPDPGLDIPAEVVPFLNNGEYVKWYETLAQSNAGLANDGVFTYLVGNTLGGGTGVNPMVFNRGSPHDFDHWSNITKDPSWRYSNILKYFKRIEDYHGDYPSKEQHGRGGPITITRQRYAPGLETWLEGGRFLGYPIADPNGPQIESFAVIEFNRRCGRRLSSYKGYIKPILESRRNLKLVKNAKVNKVIIEGHRAVGVKYLLQNGKEVTVFVTKEVILSAGVLSSPVILLKSGIGPKQDLQDAKIPLVKDLQVGKNLMDHVFLQIYFNILKNKADLFIPERDLNPQSWKIYQEFGDGPYSNFNGITAQAFLVSSVRAKEEGPNPVWPDISVHLVQMPTDLGVNDMAEVNKTEEVVSISAMIMLTRPKSRGRVSLNVSDVQGDPLVTFEYLTHPDDMDAMIDAVKKILKLFEETPLYQRQGAHYSKASLPLPFCEDLEFRSDEYWKCLINHITICTFHGAGSCQMGAEDDPEAVVNSNLKVIGIDGLRVADASIMPAATNANTGAPSMLIGEKVSVDILKFWAQDGDSQAYDKL